MGTLNELRHILGALPDAIRKSEDLPSKERAARLWGVPFHLVDLAALTTLRLVPDGDPSSEPGRRVLVLHGYAGHPRSHSLLRRHLRQAGYATESVDMRGEDNVQGMGDWVRDWILEHVEPDEPIAIVAHSLGGVVARFALREEGVRQRVDRLITLGSPHEGTRIAELVESEKASQMERDAELTKALEQQEPWDESLPRLTCFWSRDDLMMVPPEAAIADGAEAQELEGITHYGYMLRPRVWRAVEAALAD